MDLDGDGDGDDGRVIGHDELGPALPTPLADCSQLPPRWDDHTSARS